MPGLVQAQAADVISMEMAEYFHHRLPPAPPPVVAGGPAVAPPFVAPALGAAPNLAAPLGRRIPITYGSIEDPVEQIAARDRLYNAKLAEVLPDGTADAQVQALGAYKAAIKEDMASEEFYRNAREAQDAKERQVRLRALHDSAAAEAGTNHRYDLVPAPVPMANPTQREHHHPPDKLCKQIINQVGMSMSVTLDGPVDHVGWFRKVRESLTDANLSAKGILRILQLLFKGPLAFLCDDELEKDESSVNSVWFDAQIEVSQARNPQALHAQLLRVTSEKPSCPAITFREIKTLVRLIYGGPDVANTVHVLNTTRQMWLSILSRFYPTYSQQILKKDKALRDLLEKTVKEANGQPISPDTLSYLDPVEGLYRSSRAVIPKWNDDAAGEQRNRAKVNALENWGDLVGSLENERECDDADVYALQRWKQQQGASRARPSMVNAAEFGGDLRFQALNDADGAWDSLQHRRYRDMPRAQSPSKKFRGARVSATEGQEPKPSATYGMNALNAFGKNYDRSKFNTSSLALPGASEEADVNFLGFKTFPPGDRRCFACGIADGHFWRSCPHYPEVRGSLDHRGLALSPCTECSGLHQGECRTPKKAATAVTKFSD